MRRETRPFDAAEYLDDVESQSELLADAFESGDAGYIAQALDVVARARTMVFGQASGNRIGSDWSLD